MVAAASATSPFELRGDRRGVLLLHGFTGTPFEVRSLGEALHARLGVTVSGPLLAGHGGSARALAATGWRDWEASALSALVELRARCDGVVVAGLSMGGLLALRLALVRQKDVAALALLSVPLWLPGWTGTAVRALDRMGLRVTVPKLGGSDVRDRAARRSNPSGRGFPVRALAELLDLQEQVRRDLPAVQKPTLIVHAEHDHTAPPACARALASRLGGRHVRLLWLPRSYHLTPIDVERDQVAREVGDFVAEQLSARSEPQ
ncbi:MAG TPA: alpha/beta fold hydrolase [Polyangia bacterium]|nr:alpha/beta fold hydrolase [Polyangia bacterium]